MRTLIFVSLLSIGVMICGCKEQSTRATNSNFNPVKPTFPATADSPEKQEFMAVAQRKKDYDDRRQNLKLEQGSEKSEYNSLYPVVAPPDSFDGTPPPPVDPEFEKQNNANRAKHRELGSKHGTAERDLNQENIKFMAEEYWPAVLKYAEFCHKRFLAEPNIANGGELFLIADELYENGNLDEAFIYANDLVKNGFEEADVYDLAAACSYCTDHLDLAQEYIKKADSAGPTRRTSLVCVPSDVEAAVKAYGPEQEIRAREAAKDDLPRVKLETEVGDIVIELFEDQAPETVANFIRLVEMGYYDDSPFYTMILTVSVFNGQKRRDMDGSLDGILPNEATRSDARFPFRGALTLTPANEKEGNTEFSISFRPTPFTHGSLTTFGRVIEGFDVFPKIAKYFARNPTNGLERTKVIKATVLRKRDHDYVPKTIPAEPETETAQK